MWIDSKKLLLHIPEKQRPYFLSILRPYHGRIKYSYDKQEALLRSPLKIVRTVDSLMQQYKLPRMSFEGMDLSHGNFAGTKIFRGAYAPGIILAQADLSGADLSYGIFWNAKMSGSRCHDALMIRSKMQDIEAEHCRWDRTNATDAIMTGANFSGGSLIEAKLIRTDISGANLTNAQVRGTNIKGLITEGVIGLPTSQWILWGAQHG